MIEIRNEAPADHGSCIDIAIALGVILFGVALIVWGIRLAL